MKELLKTNIYDIEETMIIMGSCVPRMQPKGYEKVKEISENIYDLCLEKDHINMAITKISGMISTGKIKNLYFVSVDKSPHCVQLHYIRHELERIMNLDRLNIKNYVIVNNELIEINPKAIHLSKNLSELNTRLAKNEEVPL